MNSLLFRSTGSNGYASFFYAQFEETTKRLTYVNAGHNPPILVRAGHVIESARREPGMEAEGKGINDVALAASAAGAQSHLISSDRADEKAAKAGQTNSTLADMEARTSPLITGGMVIGLFESCKYEQETIQLRAGDLIVAYTDGVTETMNRNAEEFSEARLRGLVAGSSHLTAQDLVDVIIQNVSEWRAGLEQHDDLTLLIMKVR